jgi:hypothetical protein
MRGYLLFVILALAQSSAFVARSPSKHVAKQLRSGSVPSSDTKLTRKPPVVRSRDQRLRKFTIITNLSTTCIILQHLKLQYSFASSYLHSQNSVQQEHPS